MNKVIFDISMSLDGFITANNRSADEPLGVGGERLHQWAMGTDAVGSAALKEATEQEGVVICGRRTYDDSIRWWGADGPGGPARTPVIVVTHEAPKSTPAKSVYTFVTDGIHHALEVAKAAAKGKNVSLFGTPDLGMQFLKAGLVDELSIHLVPVLFGDGLRLFDRSGDGHIELEPLAAIHTPFATHLRYRVVK